MILENDIEGKITLTSDLKPYKIVSKKGSMVTARRGGGKVTRYSLRFKPVSYDIPKDSTKEEDDEDLNLNMSSTFDKPSIQWNNNTKINAYTQIRTRSRK